MAMYGGKSSVWDTQMFPSSCPWCGSTFVPDRRLHNDLERAKREQVGNGAVTLDFRRLLDGSPARHGMRIHVIWYTSIVVKSSIVLHFLRSPWDFQEPPEHFGGWCDRTVTLGTSGDGEKDRDFGWDLHSRRTRHTLQGRNDVVVYPLTTASSQMVHVSEEFLVLFTAACFVSRNGGIKNGQYSQYSGKAQVSTISSTKTKQMIRFCPMGNEPKRPFEWGTAAVWRLWGWPFA